MPKLRSTVNKFFKTRLFGKEINFINSPKEPSYVQNRVRRITAKEPETIFWIKYIPTEDILFDVGANIGIYTMAAGARGITTYAFEPHAGNYNILCQTISSNPFPCTAYCVALSDAPAFDIIGIPNYYPGVSDNIISKTQKNKHGVIVKDLDTLVETNVLPQPQHMKIDIDGHEARFYEGAKRTLAKCKSILFEIENQHTYIVEDLKNQGFKLRGTFLRNATEANYVFSK